MYMIFLQTLIVGLPLGLTVLIMWVVIHRRDTTTRGALSEELIRLPGHGLMQRVVNEQQNLMFTMFGLGIGPLYLAGSFALQHSLMGKAPNWWLIGILTFGLVVWLSTRLWQGLRYLSQLSTGLHAELNAGHHLNQLMRSGFYVFHDVPGDGFNIDHVAVGPTGVFAVETKGRRKPRRQEGHKVYYTNGALEFPGWQDTASVPQASRQARWLSTWLSGATGEPCPVTPVLCIPGWWVEHKSPPPFPVLNAKQLATVLPRWPARNLDDTRLKRIVHQLEQRCRTTVSPLHAEARTQPA